MVAIKRYSAVGEYGPGKKPLQEVQLHPFMCGDLAIDDNTGRRDALARKIGCLNGDAFTSRKFIFANHVTVDGRNFLLALFFHYSGKLKMVRESCRDHQHCSWSEENAPHVSTMREWLENAEHEDYLSVCEEEFKAVLDMLSSLGYP